MTKEDVEAAGMAWLRIEVAFRDAVRLLEIGKEAALKDPLKVLAQAAKSDEFAIIASEFKNAKDRIELDRDPTSPERVRTAEDAIHQQRQAALYENGKCMLCDGPAAPCAKRHVQGRSCA